MFRNLPYANQSHFTDSPAGDDNLRIISAEQGILAQEQGISPAKAEITADEVFGTHNEENALWNVPLA